jgi:hypothetical protein
MKLPKLFWIIAGILFVAASIAINYEVKIGMHQRTSSVHEFEHRGSLSANSVVPIVLSTA